MSFDLGILSLKNKISNEEASELFIALCDGDTSGVFASSSIDDFYTELTAQHPEIDDIPEEEIDNIDLCPWSIAFDRSSGHLIISCVWSKSDYVYDLVTGLANKHGLAVYSPQAEVIVYADDAGENAKPWWKIW